jgi:hypothetical protein
MTKPVQHRHRFSFKINLPDGKAHVFEYWAKIRTPPKPARVTLAAVDAEKAIENDGCGNSQLCSMSTAITRQKNAFSHPVLGIIDYYSRTVYIASKRDKNGAIVECYRYYHHDDIANRNDKPGELKKLAAELHKDGPKTVLLSPRNRNDRTTKGGTGRRTGERSSLTMGKGDKRRYAVAMGGRFPTVAAV